MKNNTEAKEAAVALLKEQPQRSSARDEKLALALRRNLQRRKQAVTPSAEDS